MIETKTSQQFLQAVKERRSYYGISKEEVIPQEKIEEIIAEATKHTSSAFNSQSSRVIVLFGEEHDKFWNVTEDELRKVVPAEAFQPTEEKMAAFRNGSGTVLFFEDQNVVKGLQEQFALYADKFPQYSDHASGILQFIVWTALTQEGLGATLQHYQPLINAPVQETWNVPENWELVAQMPFGKPVAEAGEKDFQPIEERMRVFK